MDLKYDRPDAPLLPDTRGYFGNFGGCYVPEILIPNMLELQEVFLQLLQDEEFWREYVRELKEFSGRPTPVTVASRLSAKIGGATILLKREDLNQTGAHKANNVIGQGLVAKRLGKSRVIAETGAGQHGVATATMAARLGLEATIYMGAEDVARQRPNVFWMERLGAKVVAVETGSRTLKDAINEALRDWATNVNDTHYVLGTACGPHPFPAMVTWLQGVIGMEARQQVEALGYAPDRVYACVGGGSNAMGIFQGFLGNKSTRCVGVEAGGTSMKPGEHACRIAGNGGTHGIAQGYETLFLQDSDGQMAETHSVSAGLDYVGISPILAHLSEEKKVDFTSATDQEVLDAAALMMQTEGIIPALESSHGIAACIRDAKDARDSVFLVNVSGRGDKDIFTFAEAFGDDSWREYLLSRAGSPQKEGST